MNMTIIDDAVLPVDDAVLPAENKTMKAREGNNISCVNYVVKRKAKKAIKHGSQIGNSGKSLRNKKNRILKTGVIESGKQSIEKSGEVLQDKCDEKNESTEISDIISTSNEEMINQP
ncbi:hypothetical protein JTB14_025552 [Gonioctena quinquepunctata]|nr:hypothetical protein JTB14_025552 [Gonioctena quinquepunctata]